MSTHDPTEARFERIENNLGALSELTVKLGEANVRNTADIAALSEDIRRLFDGLSDHMRAHPA